MLEPIAKPPPGSEPNAAAKPIGTRYSEAPTIFIFDEVLQQIIDYSGQDLTRERGGFLLGGYHISPNKRMEYVEIRHFIPALEAASRAASLTFTHEAWAQAHREIETRHPADVIVGWQHTHPDLGVFMSGYDLFIQRHYFCEDWQIAMVVDPCRQEFGFYQWRGDDLVDCGFICVYPTGLPTEEAGLPKDGSLDLGESSEPPHGPGEKAGWNERRPLRN